MQYQCMAIVVRPYFKIERSWMVRRDEQLWHGIKQCEKEEDDDSDGEKMEGEEYEGTE